MLISRETDYAIRIIRALSAGGRMTTAEICKAEFLPTAFTYKILRKLERSGILYVHRGRDGGCELACDLTQTTLYDLVNTFDPEPYVSACLSDGFACKAKGSRGRCAVHENIATLQQNIDDQLRSLSLSKFIDI